jgi:mannose-6-phosphate isomerase-like protein (cupin superfamily)
MVGMRMKVTIPDLLSYETIFNFSLCMIDFVTIEPFAHYQPVIHHRTDEVYVIIEGEISYFISGQEYHFKEKDIFKVYKGTPPGFINFTNRSVKILSILFPSYDPLDVEVVDDENYTNRVFDLKRLK